MGEDTYGQRIRLLREAHGWSQERLGHELGLTRASVCKIELGQRRLLFTDVLTICDLFGVSLDDFASGDSLAIVREVPAMRSPQARDQQTT